MIQKLRSTGMILFVVALCLLPQIISSWSIFMNLSKFDKDSMLQIVSGLASVPLELAIFLYVLRGKKNLSVFFCILSITMNILYYWESTENMKSFLSMLVLSFSLPIAIAFFSDEINSDNTKAKEAEMSEGLRIYKEDLDRQFQSLRNDLSERVGEEIISMTHQINLQGLEVSETLNEKTNRIIEYDKQTLQLVENLYSEVEYRISDFTKEIVEVVNTQLPVVVGKAKQEREDELNAGKFICPECSEEFDTQKGLNIHKGKSHQHTMNTLPFNES